MPVCRIKVKVFGLPQVIKAIGASTVDIEVNGNTFGDLLDELERRYGSEVRKYINVQALRNGREWIKRDNMSAPISDGDSFSFYSMVAGG